MPGHSQGLKLPPPMENPWLEESSLTLDVSMYLSHMQTPRPRSPWQL